MPLEFTKSTKGKDQLVHDGFIFNKDYAKSGKTYWKCVNYIDRCKGRAHTDGERVIHHSDNHNHVPQAALIDSKKVMAKIKEKAATNIEMTPKQIVATETAGTSQATVGVLPSVTAMKKTTQRIRRAAEAPFARPTSLTELDIQPPYTMTSSNQSFLLWDSGAGDRNRILVFSTERNLELLASRNSHWMADGTFKTAPPLFAQLLTIHAIIFNTVIPLVYALLPNKTKDTYKRLIEQQSTQTFPQASKRYD